MKIAEKYSESRQFYEYISMFSVRETHAYIAGANFIIKRFFHDSMTCSKLWSKGVYSGDIYQFKESNEDYRIISMDAILFL